MSRERILVTVKTYPTLSTKYGETVCTAGVREDGTWVRLYPVPFRRLDDREQYKLFQWVECRVRRHLSDPRPETFRPLDPSELHPVGEVGTQGGSWAERRRILLRTARVHDSLDELISGAKSNKLSLAVFKPTRVAAFSWKEDERQWDPDRLAQMKAQAKKPELFDDNSWRETFQVIRKLPYSFSYRFEDSTGRASQLQVLEWQLGALYWKCLRQCGGDESAALAKVKHKYFDEFMEKDLHFFLGTTQQWHQVAPNPWVIVGVFPIPHERQLPLL